MKLKLYLYVSAICLAACQMRPLHSPSLAGTAPREFRTDSTFYRLMFDDPYRALDLLDSAVLCAALPRYEADICRAAIYYNPLRQDDMALHCALAASQSDSVRLVPQRLVRVLSVLGHLALIHGDYEGGLRYGTEGQRVAHNAGLEKAEGEMLFLIGECMMRTDDVEEGRRHMDKAVEIYAGGQDAASLQMLSHFYGEQMVFLSDAGLLAEAIRKGEERERVIERMKALPGVPGAYVDQEAGYLCSKMAYYLVQAGRRTEAAQYARRFQATDFAHTPDGSVLIVEYLLESGQYDQALALLGPKSRTDQDSPALEDRIYYLGLASRAYAASHRFQEAYSLACEQSSLRDSLETCKAGSQARSLSRLYGVEQLERQVQDAQQKRKFLDAIIAVLLALFVGTVLTACKIWKDHHTIRINGVSLLNKADRMSAARPVPAGPTAEKTGDDPDLALFRRLERYMEEDKPFLSKNLCREDILKVLQVDKNRLSSMFRKAYGGISFPMYVNEKRLDYSVRLLRNHPNYTVAAIADEAGFASVRSFQSNFKSHFSMTVSEYRTYIRMTDGAARPSSPLKRQ